jgi:hypothetical protein
LRRLTSLVKNVIDSVAVKEAGAATNVAQSVAKLTLPFAFSTLRLPVMGKRFHRSNANFQVSFWGHTNIGMSEESTAMFPSRRCQKVRDVENH